jgi:hypothetical protein
MAEKLNCLNLNLSEELVRALIEKKESERSLSLKEHYRINVLPKLSGEEKEFVEGYLRS